MATNDIFVLEPLPTNGTSQTHPFCTGSPTPSYTDDDFLPTATIQRGRLQNHVISSVDDITRLE